MANTVFRAIDSTLVLGVDDANSPEGAAADALISQFDLSNVVGRLTAVTLTVSSDVRPFFELGSRYASVLRPGVVLVSGKADRAHVNGALLRLLLGDGATSPPAAANFVQPALNIVTTLRDPAYPDGSTKVIVFGAKFDSWGYTIPDDDFVMESVTFKALRVAFEET
ncbi:hypothetical protein OM076_37710 [Solirubrobacter ginsenosidimutans]|uniref:Uncharacterized protein n=1 Tax=Solirubrobacter ginsenosidimutans TaxID=490573 RepID=A0A9X3N0N8_9ACTN|nr:hypothetical protein [Solirubrobacter ginsenosidimutans]MDA0166062.1 hypothetical protein [Solirubrobacter ginsenosidimutans]